MTLDQVLESCRRSGEIDAAGLRAVQQAVYGDGVVSLAEADALFAINDAVDAVASPEWPWVFIGAVTDLLVRQNPPRHRVDATEAIWLQQRIEHDGRVEGTELQLLLNVLRHADSVPESLELFALEQVKAHVVSNGFVTAEDVEQLRDVLYSCGSSGGVGISRMEAEVLFDIDGATHTASNDAGFQDLFVGAVANHLMMGAAPARISDDEALRREYWLHERGTIASNWKRVIANPVGAFKAGLVAVLETPGDAQPQEWLGAKALADAERITPDEARWVVDRVMRDGEVTACERALLAFLDAECAPLGRKFVREEMDMRLAG